MKSPCNPSFDSQVRNGGQGVHIQQNGAGLELKVIQRPNR